MIYLANPDWKPEISGHVAHESHFVPPTLTVLVECLDILQHQINLLEALANDVLLKIVWPTARSSSVCGLNWWITLVGWSSGLHRMWPIQRIQHWKMVWRMFDWLVFWWSILLDTRSDQYTPLMGLRAYDLKPWLQEVRILLRGYVSVPCSCTENDCGIVNL